MKRLNDILQRLKENEEIARKFFALETKILSILNFRDLVEVLLSEIQNRFGVPYAWLSIIETSEVSGLIEFIRGCPRIDGVEEITLPGDPERRTVAQKSAEGITFDEGNWSKLVTRAKELGVDLPGG